MNDRYWSPRHLIQSAERQVRGSRSTQREDAGGDRRRATPVETVVGNRDGTTIAESLVSQILKIS